MAAEQVQHAPAAVPGLGLAARVLRLMVACGSILAAGGLPAAPAAPEPAGPGRSVLVVYNSRMAESKAVAEHYAQARQVPAAQVLGLSLSTNELVSRRDFSRTLEEPLFDRLTSRRLWRLNPRARTGPDDSSYRPLLEARVRYLVLCYGVPVRIEHDPTLVEPAADRLRPELKRNGAAVDSELALLPLLRQNLLRSGPLQNWLFGATNAAQLDPTNGLLLVCRLDGPSAAIALHLVDKALDAETNGLWGRAYCDLRGLRTGDYKTGDEFLTWAAEACRRAGFDTVVDDKPETLPAEFPLSDVAIYAGWYAGEPCGPFALPTVEFRPGAIAYHLHSFSAATVRSTGSRWVGPLLAHGATATLGCVDEPYLAGTPHIGRLLDNLLNHHFTFGEAAYAAQSALSWQTTVVGDPLYQPTLISPDLLHYQLERRFSRLAEWSHGRVVNLNLRLGSDPAELVAYLQSVPLTPSSAVLQEKLSELFLLQKKPAEARAALEKALKDQPSPQQRTRLLLTLTDLQIEAGDSAAAYQTLERLPVELPHYPALLGIYQRLEALATQLKRPQDATRWHAEVERLVPSPPAASSN